MSAKNFDINSTRSRFGSVTIFRDETRLAVQLYETAILVKTAKTIKLNSGGWRTVSTKTAMNHALRQMFEYPKKAPFIRQTKGEWFVDMPNGQVLAFRDGIVLNISDINADKSVV